MKQHVNKWKENDISFTFFTYMCICVCILYTHECLHLKTSSVTKLPYQDCKQKKLHLLFVWEAQPVRPKAREMTQHGGLAGWLKESEWKGQCHEIFCFWFFSKISFPLAPEYPIRTVSNFFENLRRYSQDTGGKWYNQGLGGNWSM